MSATNYARETVAQVKAEIDALLRMHDSEVGEDGMTYRPDWDAYDRMEGERRLFILTARCDGEMVGYNVMLLVQHLHYADAKIAQNDVIYVKPEHRRGHVGLGLVRFFESAMRQCGYDKIYYQANPGTIFDALLEKLDYDLISHVRAKLLKGGE